MFVVYFAVCVIFCSAVAHGQNCKTRGEWCGDTYQCCGGCCLRNVCTDTYQDCRSIEDPCLEYSCPANEMCRLYQPRCEGCDIEKRCVRVDSSTQYFIDPDYKTISSSTTIRPVILFIYMFAIFTLKL